MSYPIFPKQAYEISARQKQLPPRTLVISGLPQDGKPFRSLFQGRNQALDSKAASILSALGREHVRKAAASALGKFPSSRAASHLAAAVSKNSGPVPLDKIPGAAPYLEKGAEAVPELLALLANEESRKKIILFARLLAHFGEAPAAVSIMQERIRREPVRRHEYLGVIGRLRGIMLESPKAGGQAGTVPDSMDGLELSRFQAKVGSAGNGIPLVPSVKVEVGLA